MKTTIDLSIIAVFSEHCYVQNDWMEIQDDDQNSIWTKLTSRLKELGVSIYFNHFALKCEDVNNNIIYIGYNDNKISFGFATSSRTDSKEIILESPQRLLIKL